MEHRPLGRTGWNTSTVGFGAWAIGGSWGDVDDGESIASLHRAVELGVNFFDTADVYGDGHSERLIAGLYRDHGDEIFVATKAGRRLNPHTSEGYTKENLTNFVERSLRNLGRGALDLLQLHCPPTDVYYMPEVFAALDDLKQAGKIRHYGVSVERVEEALKAIEFPGVQTVQIIFNMFRQRPANMFFQLAAERGVGILARVPLASGLLTGKMNRNTEFAPDDHRAFNRDGSAFDVGETFAGVDYEVGLEAVERLKRVCPDGWSMAQFALRWILMFEQVSCVIPGGRRPQQVEDNVTAGSLPALTSAQMDAVREVYDDMIRPQVHHRW
jgi:aryl-alcohol dehydrogenase-like predicted oxidoreductase